MRKVWKAVLAAALMLSVGTAWAGEFVVEIEGSEDSPTLLGDDEGNVVYTDGNGYYWTKTSSTGTTGYGKANSLTVSRGSSLYIGIDISNDYPAGDDIAVDFGDGVITIGDADSNGTLVIGGGIMATKGVAVSAGALRLLNGSVTIGSSPDLESGKTNLLSLITLDLDNSDADVHLIMEGDRSRLEVSGVAFIGADSQTGSVAELAVAGEASFGGGIVLGHGGILRNAGGASTKIMVGSEDDGVYAAGNIYMIGDSVLDGTANELVIMDKSAEESDSGAPLSSLIIQGEGNIIQGMVDVSSLKEMLVDGQMTITANSQVAVRDFRQVSGEVDSSGLLVVEGATAKVTGGLFESDVTFTNAELKSFDFEGTGFKEWLGERAILSGGANTITGVAGAGQTVNIGKYAGMVIGGNGQFVDINVNVAKEGSIEAYMDEGDRLIIVSNDASAPVKFVVESANSFKFDYESIYTNGIAGLYNGVGVDTPFLLIQAGANATVDIPDFSFSGMFGYFKFASTADDTGYGLVDYADNGIDFDGSRADADNAHATLIPVYGDAVNSGLSDMAYRAALGVVNEIDSDFNPTAALQPLRPSSLEPDDSATESYILNSLNLLDIAAGRADMSTVSLYNGSNVFGVNQVSVSTALSHAQTGMRRSDEIRRLNAMVGNSLSGNAAYASDIMNQCYVNRFWAGGFGLWEDADAYRGFAGYQYKSAGVAVGYDRMFGPNIIVGGSFAATFGEYEDKSAFAHDSDIDSYSFNLYATYTHHSGFFGSLFGGYTYSDNDIRELRLHNLTDLLWNAADYHTNTWTLGGKLGYDLKPVERFAITPSIGLTWIGARSSSHTEYLDDVAVARFSRMKTNQTYLPVELGFGYDAFVSETGKLTLSLNLGYAYNFNNDQIEGDIWLWGIDNATPYAAVSREPGHHTYTIGGGLRYAVGRFDIGAKYDYARKSKMDSHRLYGTVGVSF